MVEVIIISGNHDWHSAKWLARVLSSYYRNDKRITVRTDPASQQYVSHGKVLLAYAHGDTMNSRRFAELIPAAKPELWGATEFRYGRMAHWHRRTTDEYPGIIVETLPTMAAPDAFTIEGGFLNSRAISAYLWSGRWGLRARMERSVREIQTWKAVA